MGGIVLVVSSEDVCELRIGGQAMDVLNFFNLEDLNEVEVGDSHNGNIIINVEEKRIDVDTTYGDITPHAVKFWSALGFKIFIRRKPE